VAKVEALKDFSAEWLWRMAARGLADLGGFYVMQPIEKRRGWEAENYARNHDKQIAKLSLGQLVGLAIEVATGRDSDEQKLAAKELKVNIKHVTAVVKEELKQNKKKKKETTDKTGLARMGKKKGRGK